MSDALKLIGALYAAAQDVAIPLTIDGVYREVTDAGVITDNEGKILAHASTAGGLAFVYRDIPDVDLSELTEFAVPTTAVLYHKEDRRAVLLWALNQLTPTEDVQILADSFGLPDFQDGVPVPPFRGWTIEYFAADAFTSAQALIDASTGESEESGAIEPETFKDAIVINGPYRPEDYPQNLTFSFAKFSQAKNWQPKTVTVSAFVSNFCEHLVGEKDGLSVVMGDMVPGQRLKNAVKTLEAVGIDLDTGVSGEKVDAVLKELGVLAIRYTTHSHAKTKTEFKKDRLIKFLDTEEITTEGVQRFLREQELWEPAMIESAKYLEDTQTNRGILAVIGHTPFPKHRVIVPLAKPFVIAKEARTQEEAMKKWGKVPTALAEKLGITLDKACLDPSRLFYTARHSKKRPFETRLFVGPLFDWHSLQLDSFEDALAADIESGSGKSTNKSTTPEGRALGRWWMARGFSLQVADLIEDKCDDRIRGNGSSGFNIECPFDEYHSNPGDPEDKACFAVNAGEGTSENVMVSCRHETCRPRTTNDHIAKMIKDGWFEKADIENEDYLSEMPEDGDGNNTLPPARAEIDAAVAKLAKGAKSDEIEDVLKVVVTADLKDLQREEVLSAIIDQTGVKRRPLDKALKRIEVNGRTEVTTSNAASMKLLEVLTESLGRPFTMPPEEMGGIGLATVDGQIWLGRSMGDGFGPLCSPIMIEGGVNYEDRDYARALRVEILHPDGLWVALDIESKDLASISGTPVLEMLLKAGFSITPLGRDFVLEYLMTARPRGRTVYHRPGFRDSCFVCPTGEVLLAEGNVELAKEMRLTCQARDGSLDQWKAAVAGLFSEEQAYRLQAGVLMGWIGALCDLAGDESCAFTLEGSSSCGKSTSQALSAGHWADPKIGMGLFLRAKGTENSQEIPLERGSGTLTALDEIGEMSASASQDLMFMNQAGSAKRRMSRVGQAQKTRTWSGGVLIVSAEAGFAQRLRNEKVGLTGGLAARLVPIAYDPSARLPEEKYALALQAVANYGWSGPAFIQALADQGYVANPGIILAQVAAHLDSLPETLGKENTFRRRAARPVAYMSLAGLIGAKAGLIPADFKYEELAKRIWQDAMGSDIGPTDPTVVAVEMLLESLVSRKGHDIADFTIGTSNREALGYFGAEVGGVDVYVLRSNRMAELYDITAPVRSVRKLLDEMGLVVRSIDKDSRTWSGFPGLGKSSQYLVLRADRIDSPEL